MFIHTQITLSLLRTSSYRTRFTLEELKKRPLPEGVDAAKLETFLSDDDFKVRPQYYRIPNFSGLTADSFLRSSIR